MWEAGLRPGPVLPYVSGEPIDAEQGCRRARLSESCGITVAGWRGHMTSSPRMVWVAMAVRHLGSSDGQCIRQKHDAEAVTVGHGVAVDLPAARMPRRDDDLTPAQVRP